jgi:Zn-dependent protease/predicted transcriptional regulator
VPRGSIQLFRIFGIRIGVDVSWFVVLFLFIFILSGSFKDTLDGSDSEAYLTAVASALLFFGSLILHELGHAVVAQRLGIGISGIDLWFFGGIARMSSDTESPGDEFKVAAAGPAVTALIIAACVGIGIAATGSWTEFWNVATLDSSVSVTPATLLISWLATINLFLLAFNLVPAFPLDGGRIARAIAWKLTGDRTKATRFAATLGQVFAYILIGLGIFELVQGGLGGGLWLIVLGLFLGQAARGAVTQTVFLDKIEGVTVQDIMDSEPVAVPAEISVRRALDEFFLRYRWAWFPVVDHAGRFVGTVRQQPAEDAERTGDGERLVRSVMDHDASDWRVSADAPLEALLASEPLRRLGALMAVDAEGVLRGVVTVEQVRRALERAVTPGHA